MPVYQGRNSCTARREGIYVRRVERPGIDTIDEAVALAYMCVRDLRRGYTWDNDTCEKIKMTSGLFERRVNYIYTLAVKHGASKAELKVIDKLVEFVLRHRRLPKRVTYPDGKRRSVKVILRRMIVRVRKKRKR